MSHSINTRLKCFYNRKRAWWCSRPGGHIGPCALRPRWWNLRSQWSRMRGWK